MARFRWLCLLGVFLSLLQGLALAGEERWICASTTNLELLTTGEAALAAEAVAELEGLRSYIRREVPSFVTTTARLRIVAFSSEGEYHAFRVNSYSPAYFVGGPGRPTIVLGRLAKQSFPSLRHEYIHALLASHSRHLPLWLEEGLADYYGGVSDERASQRSQLLARGGWIRLAELADIERDSSWYNKPAQAARFYAQSWALVSFLIEHGGSGSAERLLGGAWPANPDGWNELEEPLRAYARRLHASGALTQTETESLIGPAERADVLVAMARLKARAGDFEQARTAAAEALATRPEAWAILGDIAFQRRDDTTARHALREAMRLDAADSRALWQLAVIEQSAPDGNVVPVLERLLTAEPAHDEARLVLSSHYLRMQRWRDALEQLRQVRNTPPDKSTFYRGALALAEAHASSPVE